MRCLAHSTTERTSRNETPIEFAAALPRVAVEKELANGTLVALPWRVPFTMKTQILWRRVERLPRPLQALLEVARKTTAEDATIG